jgi:hypothetical protein
MRVHKSTTKSGFWRENRLQACSTMVPCSWDLGIDAHYISPGRVAQLFDVNADEWHTFHRELLTASIQWVPRSFGWVAFSLIESQASTHSIVRLR